jgi:hypothetical protein
MRSDNCGRYSARKTMRMMKLARYVLGATLMLTREMLLLTVRNEFIAQRLSLTETTE